MKAKSKASKRNGKANDETKITLILDGKRYDQSRLRMNTNERNDKISTRLSGVLEEIKRPIETRIEDTVTRVVLEESQMPINDLE